MVNVIQIFLRVNTDSRTLQQWSRQVFFLQLSIDYLGRMQLMRFFQNRAELSAISGSPVGLNVTSSLYHIMGNE